jgi:hypothetical protein
MMKLPARSVALISKDEPRLWLIFVERTMTGFVVPGVNA